MVCAICLSDTQKESVFNALRGDMCEYCISHVRKIRLCGLTWPMPHITGPEPWEDSAIGTIIAIFDSKIIGLRCAKIKYGIDAVAEIAKGYRYLDERRDTIVRITVNDVPETERCGKCGLSLWSCNSLEVMI